MSQAAAIAVPPVVAPAPLRLVPAPAPVKARKPDGKPKKKLRKREADPRNQNVTYETVRTPDGSARLLTASLPLQHPDEKTTIAPEHLAACHCPLGGRHATGGVMEIRAREGGRPALCVNCAADAAYEREQALAELLGIRGSLYEYEVSADDLGRLHDGRKHRR